MCVDVNLPYSMHTPYFIAHISYTYRPVMRAYAGTGGYEKMCVCVCLGTCVRSVCVFTGSHMYVFMGIVYYLL